MKAKITLVVTILHPSLLCCGVKKYGLPSDFLYPIHSTRKQSDPCQQKQGDVVHQLGRPAQMEESSSTSMSGEIKKMLLLQSSDGKQFEVAELAAGLSVTIKHMMEDGVADGVIPLPNVTGVTLAKVLEYCNKHAPRPTPSEEQEMTAEDLLSIKEWDKEYVQGVDMDTLYDLILAANYLEVQGLLSLTCQRVADMIKGKTPEQIRQTFNIKNDFTPEEEEAVRKENQWAFETE